MRRRRATVQWRHLVNWHEAARCGEWAQHFSNAFCYCCVDIQSKFAEIVHCQYALKPNNQLSYGMCYDYYLL